MTNETKGLSIVQSVSNELKRELSDPSAMRALVATTFKGLKNETVVKQACLEAMMLGYSFQDLVRKKIYAIPFGGGYSLVQSIADVRAKAMRGGQTGKAAPIFEDDPNGKIKTCSITVYKRDGHVDGYTATVYFSEYDKGRDNWKTKPRTMIAKVAEMHALRMAFPEELSDAYIEDEMGNDDAPVGRYEEAKAESKGLKMGALLNTKNEKPNKKEKSTSKAKDKKQAPDAEGDEVIQVE